MYFIRLPAGFSLSKDRLLATLKGVHLTKNHKIQLQWISGYNFHSRNLEKKTELVNSNYERQNVKENQNYYTLNKTSDSYGLPQKFVVK